MIAMMIMMNLNFKNEVLALGKIEKEVHRSIISNKKQTSIRKYFS